MKVISLLFVVGCASYAMGASVVGDIPMDPTMTLEDMGYDWNARIVGGSNAAAGQFPFQCSLRSAANAHFCGCSIINNRWVLSAAHCTVGRTTANTRVVVGTHLRLSGGVSHTTSAIRNHPSYNADTIANDVSTVQTAGAITFNNLVASIPLGVNAVGATTGRVSGWGQTSHPGSAPNNLQFLDVQTLTNADCRSRHTAANAQFVFDHKICTFAGNGRGICMGDSGGPLVVGGQVHGIASWVIPCAVGRPDAFDRVVSHRTWIVNNS